MMNLLKIGEYLQKNNKKIKFIHSLYSWSFQIGRSVFSPLLTLFLFSIQSHRITWILFNKFCSYWSTSFTEIVSKVKSKWQREILPKINKSNFPVKFTFFLILKRVNVTPVELVMRHFFHSKLRHNYAGRHRLSHRGANEATPCQNDIPFGNNSLFPIVKCRP